jgi:hypothetical protein
MSATLRFDEAASRRSEATYMTPDVVEQRRAVRAALALREGEKVLDIGSGAGLLAHEVAAEVGQPGRLTASTRAKACSRSRSRAGADPPMAPPRSASSLGTPACFPSQRGASTPPSQRRCMSTCRTCRRRVGRRPECCDRPGKRNQALLSATRPCA